MICPTCGHDNLPGEDHCAECHTDLRHEDVFNPKNGFQRDILENTLEILCTHPPTTVSESTPIREVINLMRTKNVGSVVVGTQAPFAGIFTERDALYKVAGKDVDIDQTTVGELMTREPVTLSVDKPIAAALHAMSVGEFRHLPLVKDGQLREILAIHDILKFLHTEMTHQAFDSK